MTQTKNNFRHFGGELAILLTRPLHYLELKQN
jgi:hypothetical protein